MIAARGQLAVLAVCAAVATAAPAAGASPASSWADAQIAAVVAQGLFRGPATAFRPADPISRQALADAVAQLAGVPAAPVAGGGDPVSIAELDATLVRALGLEPEARRVQVAARRAGLRPPARFGTEVVARMLGLRIDHPSGQDDLELQPDQSATRAEAAYSLARILSFGSAAPPETPARPALSGGAIDVEAAPWRLPATRRTTSSAVTSHAASWQVETARAAAEAFELPVGSDWQRRVLSTAVQYIGSPYVWAGTGEQPPGFDCSGFVWRVFKLTPYDGGRTLADTLRGRTTMAMSGEVPRSERVGIARLEPGDLLFFGVGRRSRPAQVDHAGIYLGGGFFIHSSRYGVAVAALDGWYRDTFAWARRPLAEAGLASGGLILASIEHAP